jgi:hypothetical protein
VFSALPPARLYLAGNRVICSFFGDSDNRDGSNVRHYETTVLSGLGYYVHDAFDRLWDSPETITLTEHWHMPLHVDWPATPRLTWSPTAGWATRSPAGASSSATLGPSQGPCRGKTTDPGPKT